MAADPILLQSIAFFGATALGVGIVAVGVLGLWRAMTDERPLLLSQLLALQGVEMDRGLNGLGARQFAIAARRCMDCAARVRCEDSLSAGRRDGYDAFCPNAAYIAGMKRLSL